MIDTILIVVTLLALMALGVALYGAARQRTAENTLRERQFESDTTYRSLLGKFNGSVQELGQIRDLLTVATAEIARLRPALDAANVEIHRLRVALDGANRELASLRDTIIVKVANARPLQPLLLIQCEPAFGQADAQAIRRTGIPFLRRDKCSADDFDRVLQTGREDGQTPWWVQISAHMNAERIKFFDQDVSIEWLSQRIRGVHVLFLAGCENEEIGAQLVAPSMAQHVITMAEPVESRNASDFTFAFWRAMFECGVAPDAFEQALNICPQISEFVQLRSARRR